MGDELAKAIAILKGRDEWKLFKRFIESERETSLLDFGSLEIVEKPQLLAHLSGMISQADRILRVIEEAEAAVEEQRIGRTP